MAQDNTALPQGPVRKQNAGYSPEDKKTIEIYGAAHRSAAENATKVGIEIRAAARADGASTLEAADIQAADPVYKEAEKANLAARNAYNDALDNIDPLPATFWSGKNQITESEFNAVRQRDGADYDSDVTPTKSDGTIPDDAAEESVPYVPGSKKSTELTDAEKAENQAIIDNNTLDKNIAEGKEFARDDWRVRLQLADPDTATYLYNAPNPGILAPLQKTNGLVFPYTPTIQVQYTAEYSNYDLIHSNYRGYFYKGSKVENLIITATFTANDVEEANYMLAALHFLKSATKMFYGQGENIGMPPPVLFLSGLGEYQFNRHPCVMTSMHYNLPDDVDYIPCGKPIDLPQQEPAKNSASATGEARIAGANLVKGGKAQIKENDAKPQLKKDIYTKATYVPTKIDINFTMLPIQTRDQVSNKFSLEEYASGELLKKGFW